MTVSKLLINEPPLQVLPSLAIAIGVSESIMLQQIHYLLATLKGKLIEGVKWIHMTGEEWQLQFPFWNANTIRRLLDKRTNGEWFSLSEEDVAYIKSLPRLDIV